jgi:hypothetical protein
MKMAATVTIRNASSRIRWLQMVVNQILSSGSHGKQVQPSTPRCTYSKGLGQRQQLLPELRVVGNARYRYDSQPFKAKPLQQYKTTNMSAAAACVDGCNIQRDSRCLVCKTHATA